MIFIGERINTGFKDIKQAVQDKDPEPLRNWAHKQTEAGADYLDVNLGAVSSDPAVMCWMIETVQEAVDTKICIDTNKLNILTEALKICDKPPLINSTTAAPEKLDPILSLSVEHNTSFIGLVMDASGTPKSVDKRVENAGTIVARAMEMGIGTDRVFLDPIIMPLKHMQDQLPHILEAAGQFSLFADPPPHIICGLSNASSGTEHKKLIHQTLLAMLIAKGLDSVICDVLDTPLVNTALTAELIMNKVIFADSYVRK
jgi:5-methyltetrahydrofolate corrinoid/iron sulfur protein methyltransferase